MAIRRRITKQGIVYDVMIRDPGGRQKSRSFRLRKEAEQFERYTLDKKHRDEFPEIFDSKTSIPFSELAKQWLELHSKPHKAPKSYVKDRGVIFNYLIPHFGDQPSHRITHKQVQEYLVNRLKSGCLKTKREVSPNTVNRELEIIRKMFNDGVKWGFLTKNPCQAIKKFKEAPRKIDYLTENEVKGLLIHCQPKDRALFAMAVYTGMRFGELTNLRRENVDLKNKIVTVEIGSAERATTKSGKIRYIPIATSLLPILKQQMAVSGPLVFPSKLGGDLRRTEVTKAYDSALKKAGVTRHIRFHDLRHTFASHFVMRGGDMMSLKEILGHSDLQMVQRYAHLAPDHLRRGIEKLKF